MTAALYLVATAEDERSWARGTVDAGPVELLDGFSLADALGNAMDLASALRDAVGAGPVPAGARLLAPVDDQEIWAAGVTYRRSRDARMSESGHEPDCYDRVYAAERPELFLKAPAWRARGSGDAICVRADSSWNVPEPELALVLTSTCAIAGYTIVNDVSSRDIEGENPLYLPQAKVYDGACALGPCIVPASDIAPPFDIQMSITRASAPVFSGRTSTANLHRDLAELARWLGRALSFPAGAVLSTGTGIVPGDDVTLLAGDVVHITIGGIGTLENAVEVVGR